MCIRDRLIAFMMVYNAIKGNYTGIEGNFEDVPFPYLYVSSPDDYKAYEQYFVDQLPYTDEELVAMSELSLDDLKATAAGISIEDAAQRLSLIHIFHHDRGGRITHPELFKDSEDPVRGHSRLFDRDRAVHPAPDCAENAAAAAGGKCPLDVYKRQS